MRFRLRFQSEWPENLRIVWALVGLAVAAAALVVGPKSVPRWVPILQLACWLGVGDTYFSGYCEFRENGLLVRQRGRKRLIPYESLVELRARPEAYGVLAVTDTGKRVPITVAETPLFLREAYRRLPRLNPVSSPA
jgi:hypothetical protein